MENITDFARYKKKRDMEKEELEAYRNTGLTSEQITLILVALGCSRPDSFDKVLHSIIQIRKAQMLDAQERLQL